MGLGWRIDAKAVPGHEEEAKRIRQSFAAVSAQDKAQLVARYQVITVPPFTTLGAPVIGKDDVANAWLLEQYRSQNAVKYRRQIHTAPATNWKSVRYKSMRITTCFSYCQSAMVFRTIQMHTSMRRLTGRHCGHSFC
jgi:hypothetical protein